ncbi:hypothetical protein V8C44DRAFT_319167 [Trichoderma aethiopicum]
MSSMTICTAHGAWRTADTTRPSSRLCARVKQEHAKPSASTKSFSSPVRHLVGCRLRSIEKAYQILCSQQPATTLLIGDKSSSPHHGFVSQKQVGSSTALLMKTRRISSRYPCRSAQTNCILPSLHTREITSSSSPSISYSARWGVKKGAKGQHVCPAVTCYIQTYNTSEGRLPRHPCSTSNGEGQWHVVTAPVGIKPTIVVCTTW